MDYPDAKPFILEFVEWCQEHHYMNERLSGETLFRKFYEDEENTSRYDAADAEALDLSDADYEAADGADPR